MAKTLAKLQNQFYGGGTKYVSKDNRYTFWQEGDINDTGNAVSHANLHVTLHDNSFNGPGGALSRFHVTYYYNGQGHRPIHVYFAVEDGLVRVPEDQNRAAAVDADGCGAGDRNAAIANATGARWNDIQTLAVQFVQHAFGESARAARRGQQF